MARLVNPLVILRDEFNEINPKRDKRSDGWIADLAHMKAGTSDHIPDATGDVRALDVDKSGVPMGKIVPFLVGRCRSGQERRLRYIIYNRTIWSASWGWRARRYTGANPHTAHAHFSASSTGGAGDFGIAATFAHRTESAPAASRPRPAGKHQPGTRALELKRERMSGADVRFVQEWIGPDRAGRPDGVFGAKTMAGVVWYQKLRGITADGVVGPKTWRQMGVRWTG